LCHRVKHLGRSIELGYEEEVSTPSSPNAMSVHATSGRSISPHSARTTRSRSNGSSCRAT
jgi:hypothetical protein